MQRFTLTVVLVVCLIAGSGAQTTDRMTFEVASVRASLAGEASAPLRRGPGGSLSAINHPLRTLITLAYGVAGYQIVGAPDWTATEQWDVMAKADRDIPPAPAGEIALDLLMLRALLEDRFKLVARRGTREMPIYALVIARDDGRLGSAMRRPADDYCERMRTTAALTTTPLPVERECGLRADGLGGSNASFTARSVSLPDFARSLSGMMQRLAVDRIVVDRTRLTGEWDFDMKFAAGSIPAPDSNSPSIFTALPEQLGLKLEATTGVVDVLLIERVERPTEN